MSNLVQVLTEIVEKLGEQIAQLEEGTLTADDYKETVGLDDRAKCSVCPSCFHVWFEDE